MSSQLTNRVPELTNEEQAKVDFKPLKLNEQLTNSADSHSDSMVEDESFDRKEIDDSKVSDRIIKNSYKYSTEGENQENQSANNLEDGSKVNLNNNTSLKDNSEPTNNSNKANESFQKTVDWRFDDFKMPEYTTENNPVGNTINLVSTEVKDTNLLNISEVAQVGDFSESNSQQLYNLLSKSWLGSWLDDLSNHEEIKAINAKSTNINR